MAQSITPQQLKKKWDELEKHVRTIASYLWDKPAVPRTINGVKIDCVVERHSDYLAIVEVSKEDTLEKLRTDLAKFASVRPFLFSQNIYAECYFICENEPPPSLIETGKGLSVAVMSCDAFDRLFFDFHAYEHARSRKKFGSAVDPTSGEKDSRPYVPVHYIGWVNGKEYTIQDIVQLLVKGNRVILLGNYGTGKSRCVQELFASIIKLGSRKVLYPIAVDLRDNWGTKRGHELIQRHFDGLGMTENAYKLIKIIDTASPCFLLDGFDEIGSQAWSDDPAKLKKLRAESLAGVADLISRTKGGVILTGREHYFNSEDEMYQCLGVNPETVTVLRCADEFTDAEMASYLSGISKDLKLPSWLPRRPLMCQIISEMDRETIDAITKDGAGEASFWNTLIDAICTREARISHLLDADTIRRIMRRIARLTREKGGDVGPIAIAEINRVFEEVTGLPPVDESAIMLQRLPALGRLASESSDRQFVDIYILDGLRAEDLIDNFTNYDQEPLEVRWVNPLKRFGVTLLAGEYATTANTTAYIRYMKQAALRANRVLSGDLLSAMLISGIEEFGFDNLEICDTHINFLDFSSVAISKLAIKSSFIDELDISECRVVDVLIEGCDVKQLYGVAAGKGLPEWMQKNEIANYEAVNTVARIKQANLTMAQRIFITIIKKLFFQPGAGRQEEALTRGLGASTDRKVVERILKRLYNDGVIDVYRGKHGAVYTPNRQYARRMDEIISKLSLSKDPLWICLDKLVG